MDRTTVAVVGILCTAFAAMIVGLVLMDSFNERAKAEFLSACVQHRPALECAASWRAR